MKSCHMTLTADLIDDTYPNYTKEQLEREIITALVKELYLKPQNFKLTLSEN